MLFIHLPRLRSFFYYNFFDLDLPKNVWNTRKANWEIYIKLINELIAKNSEILSKTENKLYFIVECIQAAIF